MYNNYNLLTLPKWSPSVQYSSVNCSRKSDHAFALLRGWLPGQLLGPGQGRDPPPPPRRLRGHGRPAGARRRAMLRVPYLEQWVKLR